MSKIKLRKILFNEIYESHKKWDQNLNLLKKKLFDGFDTSLDSNNENFINKC